MKLQRAAFAAPIVLLAMTSAVAQSGGLRVRVADAKDRTPLPGASVILSHETQNVGAATEVADRQGMALFPVLRPGGGYVLEVSFPGYATVRVVEVRVRISDTEEVPVGLWEAIRETVVVTEAPQAVDLDKTKTSTTFSDDFLQDLPVLGRFYQNMLTLAPGVLDEDGDGNPNVHGSRERDFKAIVSGVSNVDPLTGERLGFVNPDTIEEIEIITAGAGVEYGRAQGGFANIIQKQGSNEFEGLFGFLFRTSRLDGKGATGLSGHRVPKFRSFQPSFQVSGPVVRDRLWYVVSHEYVSDETPVNLLSGVVVTKLLQPIGADRLTWQVSPRNKLAFQYQYDPLTLTNFGVSSTLRPASSQRRELGGPTYAMEWTAPYSPKLLVDSTVAYQDFHFNVLPMTTGVPNHCVTGYSVLERAQCFDLATGTTSGSYFQSHRDKRQRLTVRSQAEVYAGKLWGTSHQLKLGFIVENERYFRDLERGTLGDFFALSGLNTNQRLFTAEFFVPETTTSRATGTTWGAFVEDKLRPLANLTVTLGVRLDQEIIDSKGVQPGDPEAESRRYLELIALGVPPQQAMPQVFTAYEAVDDFIQQLARILDVEPSLLDTVLTGTTRQSAFWAHRRRPGDIHLTNTNVSPFFGAAWDPRSDGKMSIKFTAGRHYDKIPLIVPTVELEPSSASITFRAMRLYRDWVIPSGSGGRLPGQIASGINPAIGVSAVDRGLRTPYQDEWTFSFEREMTAETLLRLTYVRRKFRDQLQDIDINHAPGDYGRCVLQLTSPLQTRPSSPSPTICRTIVSDSLRCPTEPHPSIHATTCSAPTDSSTPTS